MPELSRFGGMVIYMLFMDTKQHNKPHVHVYYGDYEAAVGIDGELLAVFLTKKQLKMVVGWMIFHKEEAYKAWNMAVRGKNMKDKVFNYLTTVPKGKVVTYGQIASLVKEIRPVKEIIEGLFKEADEVLSKLKIQ